jgi:membrane-bound lytic murein transglycosylase D
MRNMKNSFHYILLILACGIIFSASGCATNVAGIDELTQEECTEDLEDMVDGLDLPADDGLLLSDEERTALNSTGELDADLTPAQKIQVERYFKNYLHKHRADFERYLQRAELYLPYVYKIFAEADIPAELVNLAIVESGYNPKAVSRAGATGMWQFMRGTGQRFGLANNYWLDERRDPYKSTVAAATYLKQLYELFGDWHLAIASYNAGEGKISRALEHTGADDFFELCRLNQSITTQALRLKTETQQYVPRFLAVTKIMRNLKLLGFTAPDPQSAPVLTPVQVGPGADLVAVARNIGMNYTSFKVMNPAYNKNLSPLSGSSTAYVPAEYAEKAVAWLARPQARRFAGWQQYKVRRGDSFSALGQRYGVSAAVLSQANNQTGKNLREGSMILVPGGNGNIVAADPVDIPTASASRASGVRPPVRTNGSPIHTVLRGENLYRISLNYGVSLASLLEANGINAEDTHLMAGQKLLIPTGAVSGAAGKPKGAYVVQKGDTLYSLAQRNKISLDELKRINSITSNIVILPGQELLIP